MGTVAVYKQRSDGFWQVYWENEDTRDNLKMAALKEAADQGLNIPEELALPSMLDPDATERAFRLKQDAFIQDDLTACLVLCDDYGEMRATDTLRSGDMIALVASTSGGWVQSDSGTEYRVVHDENGEHHVDERRPGDSDFTTLASFDDEQWDMFTEKAWLSWRSRRGAQSVFVSDYAPDSDSHPTPPDDSYADPDQEPPGGEEAWSEDDSGTVGQQYTDDGIPVPDFSQPLGSPQWPFSAADLLDYHSGQPGVPLPRYHPIPEEQRKSLAGMRYFFPGFRPRNVMEAAMLDCLAHEDVLRGQVYLAKRAMRAPGLSIEERQQAKRRFQATLAQFQATNMEANRIRREVNDARRRQRWQSRHPHAARVTSGVRTGAEFANFVRHEIAGANRVRKLKQAGVRIPPKKIPDPSIPPEQIRIMRMRGERIPTVTVVPDKVSKQEYRELMKPVLKRRKIQRRRSVIRGVRRSSDRFFLRTLKSPLLAKVARALLPRPR